MTTPDSAVRRPSFWLMAMLPLLLLGGLLAILIRTGPADLLRGDRFPPVERLAFQRVVLDTNGITATVINDGPDPVTIAQVQVDDAYWAFEAEGGTTLPHLRQTKLVVPYPWVHGETHVLRLVTSTGFTFDHEIAVAVETPAPDVRFFAVFTLIGIYVGVIPVAIGLLWFPLVSRLSARGVEVVLALTIGLLVFLLIDAVHEGLEASAQMPASYQGTALLVAGVGGAYLLLESVGRWLKGRKRAAGTSSGWVLALMVAVGIGLHNFGEGLAIGSAFSLGEAALGTLLVIGFTLHNTTEGLAIVAPLARERPSIGRLAQLGLIGGVPTIAGAWLGGFVYSPLWSVLFLGVGAGAIAQVVVQIGRQMAGAEPVGRYFSAGHVMGGLAAGFVMMYMTGLLLG